MSFGRKVITIGDQTRPFSSFGRVWAFSTARSTALSHSVLPLDYSSLADRMVPVGDASTSTSACGLPAGLSK